MHCPAKFLLLVDNPSRMILLDAEYAPLGEVIEEDGFIADSLMRSARPCPVPGDVALSGIVPPPSAQQAMRCFELH